jgi:WD40-like Beta Propeller Repeat
MTANQDFERQLGAWLRDDSAGRVPDHINQVLVQSVATRQRSWWSSPARWLPFDADRRVRTIPFDGRRSLLLMVIVAAIVAALLILAVGSRRHLPPPFGPARNGAVVVSQNGDLFSVDPKNGLATLLAGNSKEDDDFGPVFSRDGTKLAFLRSAIGGLEIVVANADGSAAHVVSPAVEGLDWLDWSPDGTRIAFLSQVPATAGHHINVVNDDGSALTTLEVGRPANQISWLPPDGTEILFRGEHVIDSDPPPGIFAVRPDGTRPRQISTGPALNVNDYNDLAVSPDGRFVAYRDVAFKGGQGFRVRILDLQTGEDRILPADPATASQGGPGFSPDGRSVMYLRWFADASTQIVVAPVDGSSTGIPLGPHGPLGPDGPTINNYGFAPDGMAVFANYDAEKVARLLPVDGSPGVLIARGDLALVTYQRLAP